MSAFKSLLVRGGRRLELLVDSWRFGRKLRTGRLAPVEILPYRGHGSPAAIFLKGRVVEGKAITRSAQTDTILANLRNMGRRFVSDEIPRARVRARFGDLVAETEADAEGFFEVRFGLPAPPDPRTDWHAVGLELIWPKAPGQRDVRAKGHVLVPRGAEFGVISDIDDTVVKSRATGALTMAWIALLNNAHTRLPFAGVAAFYHALRRGAGGEGRNPIFYVSSSPWNIYDLLEDFMDVHGVPVGPIFLKDWSPTALRKHDRHKLQVIRTLLATYPDLPFVLIGDSGQRDPEIYRVAANEHPGRIRVIYIRDVTGSERRSEVRAIAAQLESSGTEMRLVPDTAAAADHALKRGLISPGSAREVHGALG